MIREKERSWQDLTLKEKIRRMQEYGRSFLVHDLQRGKNSLIKRDERTIKNCKRKTKILLKIHWNVSRVGWRETGLQTLWKYTSKGKEDKEISTIKKGCRQRIIPFTNLIIFKTTKREKMGNRGRGKIFSNGLKTFVQKCTFSSNGYHLPKTMDRKIEGGFLYK